MAYINGNKILGVELTGLVNIDGEMSATSEAPVQNKVISNSVANALKGNKTARGYESLVLNDISPIEHELNFSLSKNLWVSKGVTYPYAQKGVTVDYNPATMVYTFNGTSEGYTGEERFYIRPQGETVFTAKKGQLYTLKIEVVGGNKSDDEFNVFANNVNLNSDIFISTKYHTSFNVTQQCLNDGDIGLLYFYIGNGTFNNWQIRVVIESHDKSVNDFSGVEVTRQGKNLIPYPYNKFFAEDKNGLTYTLNTDGSIHISGTTETRTDKQVCGFDVSTLRGKTVCLIPTVYAKRVFVHLYYNDGTETKWNFMCSANKPVATIPENAQSVVIGIDIQGGTTINEDIYLQLEIGTTATEYTPYVKPQIATVTADGIVEGLTSTKITTIITANKPEIFIECKYNRDINKAFAELQALILNN